MAAATGTGKRTAPTLDLAVYASDLGTAWVELQVVHVPPSGIISFPNRSAFEVTHSPGSSDILAPIRSVSINLNILEHRFGKQAGHLYAVSIHSQPRTLEFREMSLTVRGPGVRKTRRPLNLADHAALLGVWWQGQAGEWHFEYSGQVLDTLNALHQVVYMTGRYAERFSER